MVSIGRGTLILAIAGTCFIIAFMMMSGNYLEKNQTGRREVRSAVVFVNNRDADYEPKQTSNDDGFDHVDTEDVSLAESKSPLKPCRHKHWRLLAEGLVRQGCTDSVLVHLHAHRSSGTSMCKMAEENGMNVPDFACNPFSESIPEKKCKELQGTVQPFMDDAKYTCRWGDWPRQRLHWAKEAGNKTYVSEEFYGMPSWDNIYFNGRFAYSTTFRNPMSRMQSDWLGGILVYDSVLKVLEALPDNMMTRIMSTDRLMSLSHRRVLWNQDYLKTPDAVEKLFALPVGESDYLKARENLGKLSAVLLLEDLNGTLPLMAYKFGWTKVTPVVHENNRQSANNPVLEEHLRDPKIQSLLLSKNTWDIKLYHDALYVVSAQLKEAIANCPDLDRCKDYVPQMKASLDWINKINFSPAQSMEDLIC